MTLCAVEGCGRPKVAHGWCNTHYRRWRTHGDPRADVPITGSMTVDERLHRFVDRSGDCWLYTGTISAATGYGLIGNKGVHRLMWIRTHGPIPSGRIIDHECHNEAARRGECAGGASCPHRRCCNPDHLRLVTHGENLANSPLTSNGSGLTPCGLDGCTRRRDRASGYCQLHDRRLQAYGDAAAVPDRLRRPSNCSADGCDLPHHAGGYCQTHHARVRRHGDPLAHIPIRTENLGVPFEGREAS